MVALLALFIRSVREDMRSKSLLWTRIGIASAILISIFIGRSSSGGAPGLNFFSSVVWMNFVFICIAGISYFATPITEEKEEGTLGLLRMTDLSPFAILFGKSTSRLVGGLLILLVQVPFVMLAITLGGVHFDQVVSSYALLGAFLFFACNVGLLGSVLARRTGGAAVASGIIGTLYQCWPFLLYVAWMLLASGRRPSRPHGLFQILDQAVPTFFTPQSLAAVLTTTGAVPGISRNLIALLIGGLVAFLVSRFLFERFCGEQENVAQKPKHSVSSLTNVARQPRGRVWTDAIAWRDFHFLHGGRRAIIFKSCLYGGLAFWFAASFLEQQYAYRVWDTYFSIVFFASFLVASFESLFATSRIFRLERKDKTLSGLHLLPQSLDALIAAKRRAIVYSLLPILFIAIISASAVGPRILADMSGDGFMWAVLALAYLVAQLFLNHYLVAWFSLRVRWGGLPLALALSWIANSLGLAFAFILFRNASLFFMTLASVGVAVAIRQAFRQRLMAVIAED